MSNVLYVYVDKLFGENVRCLSDLRKTVKARNKQVIEYGAHLRRHFRQLGKKVQIENRGKIWRQKRRPISRRWRSLTNVDWKEIARFSIHTYLTTEFFGDLRRKEKGESQLASTQNRISPWEIQAEVPPQRENWSVQPLHCLSCTRNFFSGKVIWMGVKNWPLKMRNWR